MDAYNQANELKTLVFKRTGLKPETLRCPREKSEMTPCVARDGELAVAETGVRSAHPDMHRFICVGCEHEVGELLNTEKEKHKS